MPHRLPEVQCPTEGTETYLTNVLLAGKQGTPLKWEYQVSAGSGTVMQDYLEFDTNLLSHPEKPRTTCFSCPLNYRKETLELCS